MRKTRTFFEQVPLDLVKLNLVQQVRDEDRRASRLTLCAICGIPVELEFCKTDEAGDAIHEQCYIAKMARTKSVRNVHGYSMPV
jgi:hypothetical protein